MSDSLRSRVSGAMFWNTVLFPLKAVISFAASLVVVNGLKVSGFGTYSSLLAAATIIGQYTDLGVERTLPKFLPEIELRFGRRGVRLFLQWVLGFKLITYVLILTALRTWAPFFADFFDLPGGGGGLIAILGALVVLGSLSNIMVQILITFFKQKVTNLLDILTALFQPILTAVLVLLGYGVFGAVLSLLVTTVLILGLQFWQAWRAGRELAPSRERVHPRDVWSLWPRFWPYGLLIYLINVSSTIYEPDFALVVLAGLGDTAGQAVLALGVKYVREFIRFLVAPITGVQVPLFARLFVRGSRPALQQAYGSFMRLLQLALLPAGVGLVLFSRGLIQLLYLEEFAGAAGVAVILVGGMFLDSMLGSVPHNILMSYERYRPVVTSRLFILATVPLLFWMAPRYSALGLAWVMALARLGGAAIVLAYASRVLRLRYPWAFLGRVAGASAAFAVVLLPLLWAGRWGLFDTVLPASTLERVQGVLVLAGLALLGVAVFLLVFRRLGGLEPQDLERLQELRFPGKRWLLRWLY
ncbi:MAG: oligosaccharide flippase family protein [Chloroflexia bacterium]|nr:oligosaccharide flippase family protein [Chloroflexia bacterium]